MQSKKNSRFVYIIRNSFSKIWNKQFLIFCLFLFLSTSFWLFQALNETYEQEYQVPLRITNLPKDVVVTDDLPEYITVSIRDKGVTLLNYRYGEAIRSFDIDFNAYANESGHVRILSRSLLRQLNSQLNPGSMVFSIKPDTLDYYYSHGSHKRLPVLVKGDVRTEVGYTLVQTSKSCDSVTVYASEDLLENLEVAYVKPTFRYALSADEKVKLPIVAVRGAKFIPDSVEVAWQVERMVEKKVTVAIIPEGFPGGKQLLAIPQDVEVAFHVSMDEYRNVTADDFVVTAHYDDLPNDGSARCPLRVKVAPRNVSRVRLTPKEVEYIIEETAADI